nr:peptidoglycan recognition family protein [Micromonospora sp. NBS 11-29]
MHFDHPELDRRTLLRAGLGAAAVAVVGSELALPAAAQAAPGADLDWIIGCDEWAARPPSGPLSTSAIPTNKIIVHHMAFPNVTDFSEEHAKQLARDCQDLHMDGNGWSDTGQHFTVSRGGHVLEGRHGSLERLRAGDRQMIAAHCPGENGRAIGIENEGAPRSAASTGCTRTTSSATGTSAPPSARARCSTGSSRGCAARSSGRSAPSWATCRRGAGRTSGASSAARWSRWRSTCSRSGGTPCR